MDIAVLSVGDSTAQHWIIEQYWRVNYPKIVLKGIIVTSPHLVVLVKDVYTCFVTNTSSPNISVIFTAIVV